MSGNAKSAISMRSVNKGLGNHPSVFPAPPKTVKPDKPVKANKNKERRSKRCYESRKEEFTKDVLAGVGMTGGLDNYFMNEIDNYFNEIQSGGGDLDKKFINDLGLKWIKPNIEGLKAVFNKKYLDDKGLI